jgi:putative hydrolase of the HAD superfamily
MADKTLHYPTILFDWGDTVMRDDPASTVPMVEWQEIEVVEGIADVLEYLLTSDRQIILATSAAISDENQIRGALRRGGLDKYFSRIYGFKNTHLPKGDAFYSHILKDLGISASDTVMVGDGFEKDVEIPNKLGIFAVWFNPRTAARREDKLHTTVHSMEELMKFFKSLN